MPKSLADFIEGVANGTIPIDQEELISTIDGAPNARTLQEDLLTKFDCEVLFRDCVLMMKLKDSKHFSTLECHDPDEPPEVTLKY